MLKTIKIKNGQEYFDHIQKLKHFRSNLGPTPRLDNAKLLIQKLDKCKKYEVQKSKIIYFARLYSWPSTEELKNLLEFFPDGIGSLGYTQRERNLLLYGEEFSKHSYYKANLNYVKGAESRNLDPLKRSKFPTSPEIQDKISKSLKKSWHKSKRRDWNTLEFWIAKGSKTPEEDLKKAKESHARKTVEGRITKLKKLHGDNWIDVYEAQQFEWRTAPKKSANVYTSLESKRVFNIIEKRLNIKIDNFEWYIRRKNTIVFYDAKIGNLLIEYDGLAWHYNKDYPEMYRGHLFGISPLRSIRKDLRKDLIAKKNGYLLLRLHGNMTDNEIVERVGKCL